jgi:hypothetical protein
LTCFELDSLREFNDFSEIHFKINDSSVFSFTNNFDFTRQGVE